MNPLTQRLNIGRLAREAGVGIDTVCFYDRARSIPAAVSTAAGYRSYSANDIRRMRFIRRAKALAYRGRLPLSREIESENLYA